MFDISWSEFLLIGVVALIVIGPKELPAVMRTLGQWTRKVRAMAADFQNQFQEAMREAEVADLKNEFDNLAHEVRSADPVKSVGDDFATMGSDFEHSLGSPPEPAPGETVPLTPPSAATDGAETAASETGPGAAAAPVPATAAPAAAAEAALSAPSPTADVAAGGAPEPAAPVGEAEEATGRTG